MKMTGEKIIKAPRQEVWDALNNAEQLEKAIPGAEKVEKVDENNLIATVKTKIGPISARFSGKIKLSDINPPISYVLTGEGTGGAAGFAKGEARITLEDIGQDTLLKYEVDARVGGKLAQIGQRLIDTAANKLADEFFGKFNDIINLDDKNITENLPEKSSSYEGLSTLSWGIGLITLVTLAVVFWFIIGKI
jgi:carbon monoxide dehydrogenase subunit G